MRPKTKYHTGRKNAHHGRVAKAVSVTGLLAIRVPCQEKSSLFSHALRLEKTAWCPEAKRTSCPGCAINPKLLANKKIAGESYRLDPSTSFSSQGALVFH
jgi:hypothetical protein